MIISCVQQLLLASCGAKVTEAAAEDVASVGGPFLAATSCRPSTALRLPSEEEHALLLLETATSAWCSIVSQTDGRGPPPFQWGPHGSSELMQMLIYMGGDQVRPEHAWKVRKRALEMCVAASHGL